MNELNCPICRSTNIIKFLDQSNIPTNQNLVIDNENDATNISRGNMELFVCVECEFIFNKKFEEFKVKYNQKYDNSIKSQFYKLYVEQLISKIIKDNNKNSIYLEIGCGKGNFLYKLIMNKKYNNKGLGFDPSYTGKNHLFDNRLNFEKCFFDSNRNKINVDSVICRHVIEHIPKPLQFLKTLKEYLNDLNHVKIYFETPDVNYILKNKIIWDFPYEHCSYFNKNSITKAFQLSGFDVHNIKMVYNNQYLWIQSSHNKDLKNEKNEINSHECIDLAKKYSHRIKELITNWQNKIITSSQKISIWGAAGKGTMFCNLIDPKKELFDFVIDTNPNKLHKFIAGTGHKIINYTEIPTNKIEKVIILNPNYYHECIDLLEKSNIKISAVWNYDYVKN